MKRLAIVVDGIVQGVGFRPFVYGLASRLELGGFVRNRAGSVEIEVEGSPARVEEFLEELSKNPPPLARIERIKTAVIAAVGANKFEIERSAQSAQREIFISPDVATCDDCLADLFDSTNRRYRYPFVNCTNCGPRLTIVRGAPYDRHRTTMAEFSMCADCRAEYENPLDRRFHAQPICCLVCGPKVAIQSRDGAVLEVDDPIRYLAQRLLAGDIAAVKGLGGYHLACDARNVDAVTTLRKRKHRDEKPFAVMVNDLTEAGKYCQIDPAEAALLQSHRRPIVLLKKQPAHGGEDSRVAVAPQDHIRFVEEVPLRGDRYAGDPSALAEGIAPGNPWLGIMLPYTPIHHLLMRAVGGIPLVMTSGNASDEPIAYTDDDAIQRLGSIADVFLTHNRPIHIRCDDSVTRIVCGVESPIRRSRGYAPQPVRLPISCSIPTLAVGGQLKATFALAHDHHAFVSHHMGDLDHFEAARAFERDVALYELLFEIKPQLIVCDLHPDYVSTHYAKLRAQRDGIPLVQVQHHHAHLASCMAENGLTQKVIGVCFDGTGYGTDGTVWGGEFLVGDCKDFHRAAHLRPVGMPGADTAIRQPWRMALSHLIDCGLDDSILADRIDASSLRIVRQMISNQFNTPLTSSAGRLFDAVASLVGLRDRATYEAQVAIELERLACSSSDDGSYFAVATPASLPANDQSGAGVAATIETRPIIQAVVAEVHRGTSPAVIARRFHNTMADLITNTCRRIRESKNLSSVTLSGGVFLNALLSELTTIRLKREGFAVHTQTLVPPNDGGISLGQLAVAAARQT